MNHSNQYIKAKQKEQELKALALSFILGVGVLFGSIEVKNHLFSALPNPCADGCKAEEITHITVSFKDPRSQKLYETLKRYNSPMAGSAGTFVQMADKYGIDWTLMPAIAGKESSFGKHLANDYNPFGLTTGKSSGPRFRPFTSFDEAIEAEAQLLSKSYKDEMYGAIQVRYCPSSECSDTWTQDVLAFSREVAK